MNVGSASGGESPLSSSNRSFRAAPKLIGGKPRPAPSETDEPGEAGAEELQPRSLAPAFFPEPAGDDEDASDGGEADVDVDSVPHALPLMAGRAAPGLALIGGYGFDEVPPEKSVVEHLVLPGEADIAPYEIRAPPAPSPWGGYFGFSSFFPSCTSLSPRPTYEVCGSTGSEGLGSREGSVAGAPPRALILFDWDDTLCPTSWIEDHPELGKFFDAPMTSPRKSGETWNKLKELSRAVADLVSTALALGDVALVTLAERPWVPVAIQEFMPEVGAEVTGLDVFYARELANHGPVDPGLCPWTTMKRLAMQQAMTSMEAQYASEFAWKSFISVGDSEVEKRAAQQLGTACKARGKVKWTKTVKFAAQPDVTQLICEVRAMNDQLAGLVAHPGHKDVNVAEWMSGYRR